MALLRPLATLCIALCISQAALAADPPPGYTRVQQDDPAAVYAGAWETVSSSTFSGGSAAHSDATKATVQFSFTGTAVQWIGSRGPNTGEADIFLDGVHVTVANTKSKQPVDQAVIYAVSGLTRASHVLTLSVKSPGKRGPQDGIWVDAFDVLPPSSDTTPPTVVMTAPADGASVSGSVTVSANASDDTGVASVQFQLDDQPLGSPDTTTPYSMAWDSSTVPNGSHTLLAVARDAAGNIGTSAPVHVTVSNSKTRVEQDDPAVTYGGIWVTASDPTVSGGTAIESNQAGATASLYFSGTGVDWIGYRCTCASGFAQVSVDGGPAVEVDNYSAVTQPQAVVFSANGLPRGNHSLKITVTGDYDRAGETAYVVVDAFDISP